MKYTYWVRIRAGRLLVILLAVALYICLVVVDGMRVFPGTLTSYITAGLPWVVFGLSVFVSLMFLGIGSLVWVYARNRSIALLLFSFSCTMMMTFAVQSGASLGDPLLSAIGAVGADTALLLLAILLFSFPSSFSHFHCV